jgi:hypothetical protein
MDGWIDMDVDIEKEVEADGRAVVLLGVSVPHICVLTERGTGMW